MGRRGEQCLIWPTSLFHAQLVHFTLSVFWKRRVDNICISSSFIYLFPSVFHALWLSLIIIPYLFFFLEPHIQMSSAAAGAARVARTLCVRSQATQSHGAFGAIAIRKSLGRARCFRFSFFVCPPSSISRLHSMCFFLLRVQRRFPLLSNACQQRKYNLVSMHFFLLFS